MKKLVFIVAVFVLSQNVVLGKCIVGDRGLKDPLVDIVSMLLEQQASCPKDIMAFKELLKKDGLSIESSMVANRGRHNPKLGSFSIFEVASGKSKVLDLDLQSQHLYFGHFTRLVSGQVVLDDQAQDGKLLIELIAWDFEQKIYNFYELIGTGANQSAWFFRGNSLDALKDNAELHLGGAFGNRMRYSGCHSTGGPIMKELQEPHNDWWTVGLKLVFAPNQLGADVAAVLSKNMLDASDFSRIVKRGMNSLYKSPRLTKFMKEKQSLRQVLRPLFCGQEINLESGTSPLESNKTTIKIPDSYFVNPLFLDTPASIEYPKDLYLQGLSELRSKFPEVNKLDADHGWLTPVKSYADQELVRLAMKQEFLEEEFVLDVLAVDFKNPLFSSKRCSLLKEVPESRAGWLAKFKSNLGNSSDEAAKELLQNINNPELDSRHHKNKVRVYVEDKKFDNLVDLKLELKHLNELRRSVYSNAISQNPRGQILEPGFRVIFSRF